MKFFTYHQNNSGGVFHSDEQVAPVVIIEAESAYDANDIALEVGIYFDGEGDCPCCGSRWQRAWDDEEGDDWPRIYGQSPLHYVEGGTYYSRSRGTDTWEVIVYYANGDVYRYAQGRLKHTDYEDEPIQGSVWS